MSVSRINRGHKRRLAQQKRTSDAFARANLPEQHPEPDMRVAINFTAPMHPGAFAHVLAVVPHNGMTLLRVCLENHKHIRFTLPLHDCRLTQHHA